MRDVQVHNSSNKVVKFLTVVALISLYMEVWALLLLGLIKLGGNNDSVIARRVLISIVILLAGFVPYMDSATNFRAVQGTGCED